MWWNFLPFYMMYSITLHVYTTFCLFIHPLMDIWVASTSWLLWIVLFWTWMCTLMFYFAIPSWYKIFGIFSYAYLPLVNTLFRSFTCFKLSCLFSYCLVFKILYIFWTLAFKRKHFFPVHGLSFYFLNSVFHKAEVLSFNKAQLTNFSLTVHAFGVVSKKSSPNNVTYCFSFVVI